MLSKIVRLIERLKVVRFTSKIVRVDRSATTIIIYLKKKVYSINKNKTCTSSNSKNKNITVLSQKKFF